MLRRCLVCGKFTTFQCARCHVPYCSLAHQRQDYKCRHASNCLPWQWPTMCILLNDGSSSLEARLKIFKEFFMHAYPWSRLVLAKTKPYIAKSQRILKKVAMQLKRLWNGHPSAQEDRSHDVLVAILKELITNGLDIHQDKYERITSQTAKGLLLLKERFSSKLFPAYSVTQEYFEFQGIPNPQLVHSLLDTGHMTFEEQTSEGSMWISELWGRKETFKFSNLLNKIIQYASPAALTYCPNNQRYSFAQIILWYGSNQEAQALLNRGGYDGFDFPWNRLPMKSIWSSLSYYESIYGTRPNLIIQHFACLIQYKAQVCDQVMNAPALSLDTAHLVCGYLSYKKFDVFDVGQSMELTKSEDLSMATCLAFVPVLEDFFPDEKKHNKQNNGVNKESFTDSVFQ